MNANFNIFQQFQKGLVWASLFTLTLSQSAATKITKVQKWQDYDARHRHGPDWRFQIQRVRGEVCQWPESLLCRLCGGMDTTAGAGVWPTSRYAMTRWVAMSQNNFCRSEAAALIDKVDRFWNRCVLQGPKLHWTQEDTCAKRAYTLHILKLHAVIRAILKPQKKPCNHFYHFLVPF